MEVHLDIPTRSQPGDSQYREVVQYIAERRYHRALGRLQRLVILRLFELQKLNLSRTGKRSALIDTFPAIAISLTMTSIP